LLGSGGFSDVFLYEQELPRRQVAVKVLAAEDLTDASRSAFVAEANLMAQLSAHPYIVTIYHAALSPDGRPYFVMEYCAGPSLAEQYKVKRFSVADALRTGIRLSSAVATAHAAGILHRDIKPANVLTNAYGWPALTDFGISSAVDTELPTNTMTRADLDRASGQATATGTVGMSIPWSPPELFDDHPAPDVRSDVFSLAATVYTLLAGHTPFEVPGKPNGAVDLIGRIDRGAITPMDRADIPASLMAVLHRGMATRRDARFSSAVEFARALQRVELELSYAPTAIDVPNLAVPSPHDDANRDAGTPDADATRVRQVRSVTAQPTRATAPPPAPPKVAPAPVVHDDPTVVRGVRSVPAQASAPLVADDRTIVRSAPSTDPAEPEAVGPSNGSGRRWLPIVLGAAGAVAVAAVVTAAIVLAPPPEPRAPQQPSPSAGGGIVTEGVPKPEQVSVVPSGDGTSVTFTWSNPDPQEGDRYVWRRLGGQEDGPRTPTDSDSVTIAGVTPGSQVCISVEINRNGKLSTDPLRMCTQ